MVPRDAVNAALEPAFQAIVRHPFVIGLTEGTLPVDAFSRYLGQNFLYLTEYSRALALVAARAEQGSGVEFFATRATYAIAGERSFMQRLIDELGLDEAGLRPLEPSPVCLAYSSFVKQAAALGERAEALGAVIPCYLLYWRTGKELTTRGSPDPRYQSWIDMYVDEAFEEGVRGALDALDDACRGGSLERMLGAARVAARYEWLFWDSAYRDDRWPELGM